VKKGFYAGGTVGVPTPIGGLGGGAYVDDDGNIYPQVYYGSPSLDLGAGYSSDLEGLLTGTSISGSLGPGSITTHIGTSGTSAGAGVGASRGLGIKTPGIGVTYGFGPYRLFPRVNGPVPAFQPDAVYSPMGDFYGNFPAVPSAAPDTSGPWTRGLAAPSGSGPFAAQPISNGAAFPDADPAPAPGLNPAASRFPPRTPPESRGPLSLDDAYLLYLSRVNAARARAARPASDAADASAAPLAPSDSAGFSGGLPGRIAALAGIDPDDPTRFARQPGDAELNSFVGDGPFPPWTLQRKR